MYLDLKPKDDIMIIEILIILLGDSKEYDK